MASISPASTSLPRQMAVAVNQQLQYFSHGRRSNLSFTLCPLRTRLSVSCAAKPETVDKVCAIIKKKLSLKDGDKVTAETSFDELRVDSLDLVEIMMELEVVFGIDLADEEAAKIKTVEQTAEAIEELLTKKA